MEYRENRFEENEGERKRWDEEEKGRGNMALGDFVFPSPPLSLPCGVCARVLRISNPFRSLLGKGTCAGERRKA